MILRRWSWGVAVAMSYCFVPTHTPAQEDRMPSVPAVASVQVLTNLFELQPKTTGTLSFTPAEIRFGSVEQTVHLPRRDILHASLGDEVIELGGTGGRLARMVIPFGGGQVLGATVHKRIQLLSVEFNDQAGEYHGAVFVVGADDLPIVRRALAHEMTVTTPASHSAANACSQNKPFPGSVRVQPIRIADGAEFPDEDRVLLYERLVQQLAQEKGISQVIRAGGRDASSRCTEFAVTLTVNGFKKGNQAVRAASGPLGHFIGTTVVQYHLAIASSDRSLLIDQDVTKKNGSDTDSLDITKSVGKSVAHAIRKAERGSRQE